MIYGNQPKLVVNKKSSSNQFLKAFKIATIVVIIMVLLLLMAVPPIIMNDMVNKHVDFNTIYDPKDFGLNPTKLTFETEDHMDIVGYEVSIQEPKAVVIFISGIHNPSVTAFFGHSKMLQDHGYASILYEMRAHGESEGDEIGLGYKEFLDTKAVVQHIKESEKYQDIPIVVYGLSMGAATAINSIGEIPEIDGLISMSAYSAWEDVFSDNMISMGAPETYAQIQKPFVKLYEVLKYGFNALYISPKKEIKKLGDRPAFIIHSREDSQVPFSNYERILENAPEHVETWVIEGDHHFILEEEPFLNPSEDKEYSTKIIGFLDTHFGS